MSAPKPSEADFEAAKTYTLLAGTYVARVLLWALDRVAELEREVAVLREEISGHEGNAYCQVPTDVITAFDAERAKRVAGGKADGS
jgi:hypothetical protein